MLLTQVDSIINCASLVKHFGIYDLFFNSNVLSLKTLIDFAKEKFTTIDICTFHFYPIFLLNRLMRTINFELILRRQYRKL